MLQMWRDLCVCLFVGHNREPNTMADAVWVVDSGGLKQPCVMWRPGYPRVSGIFFCSPLEYIRLYAANAAAAQDCRLVFRDSELRRKRGFARDGGDRCEGDAAFRRNSLATCYVIAVGPPCKIKHPSVHECIVSHWWKKWTQLRSPRTCWVIGLGLLLFSKMAFLGFTWWDEDF